MIEILREKLIQLFDTGAIHITLGTFATKFVAFFGSIFVVRLLSKEDYGLIGYVENIYSYALIFAGFGLCYSILRFAIIAPENKKRSYYQYTTRHSIYRDIAIALLIVAVNFFIKYPDNFLEAKIWVPVLALLLPFQDLVNCELYSLRALFKNKAYAYLSFLVSTALIIGRVFGAVVGRVGGVLWSRVIINAAFALSMLFYVGRYFSKKDQQSLEKIELRECNVYGIQMMLTNGLWALFMLNDTMLLGTLCNDAAILADYKVAYVLPGNISIFATAIGIYVGPYFTRNEKDISWVQRNFKRTFFATAGVVGLVTALIFIMAKPLITLLYGNTYANVVELMRILLVAAFVNSGLRYTSANLLSAMGHAKYNLIVSAIGVLLQVGLDALLIPKFQAYGVAVSSCLVYAFMAIILFIIFIRIYYKDRLENGKKEFSK